MVYHCRNCCIPLWGRGPEDGQLCTECSEHVVPSEPGCYWAKIGGSKWEIVELMYDKNDFPTILYMGTVYPHDVNIVVEWGAKIEMDKEDDLYGLKSTYVWDPEVFTEGSAWLFRGGKFGPEGQIGIVDRIALKGTVLFIVTQYGKKAIHTEHAADIRFVPLVEKEVK